MILRLLRDQLLYPTNQKSNTVIYINKGFDIQHGWMCEICHALNIRELDKCGTCGREKGNKVNTNEEEYLENLEEKYLEHKLRGTKEGRLVEKKTLAEQRLEERKERMRKRKEQLLRRSWLQQSFMTITMMKANMILKLKTIELPTKSLMMIMRLCGI